MTLGSVCKLCSCLLLCSPTVECVFYHVSLPASVCLFCTEHGRAVFTGVSQCAGFSNAASSSSFAAETHTGSQLSSVAMSPCGDHSKQSSSAGADSCETIDSQKRSMLVSAVSVTGEQQNVTAGALGNDPPDSDNNRAAGADSCETTDAPSSPMLASTTDMQSSSRLILATVSLVKPQEKTAAGKLDNSTPDSEGNNGAVGADSCETPQVDSNPVLLSAGLENHVEEILRSSSINSSKTPSCSYVQQQQPLLRSRVSHACSAAHATAIRASNLMWLLGDTAYQAEVNTKLCAGVPQNKRDELDCAGKVIAAVKLSAIGVTMDEIVIDPAQAGGLLGKFDAIFAGWSGIEIKAARSYRGNRSFQFSRLRPDSPFQVCVCVCVCVCSRLLSCFGH